MDRVRDVDSGVVVLAKTLTFPRGSLGASVRVLPVKKTRSLVVWWRIKPGSDGDQRHARVGLGFDWRKMKEGRGEKKQIMST